MRRLGGGYGFTKIDLADAYNQVRLVPKSRERLALSTHRGVLLQNVLPFGISSAPGYFQQVSQGRNHQRPGRHSLQWCNSGSTFTESALLLERLRDKGLRCQLEICTFAQPEVAYLGHVLSSKGIHRGPKFSALNEMPVPHDVSTLRSFLGSVQFYAKFLPPTFASVAEPLWRLTRKGHRWAWGSEEEAAFCRLKELLSTADVLAHFDPSLPLGVACDA